jgi:hypothetical protein
VDNVDRARWQRYDYCKIFVSQTDEAGVKESLAALLRGRFQRHSMALDNAVIDVRVNPDVADAVDVGDDFLRWPVVIEVERAESAGDSAIVATVSRILTMLWGAGQPAVAACDYEDELPWSGGIQRLRAT